MRVLVTGHTGLIGGGERCLLDLLGHVGDDIDPHYAGPPGPMMDAVQGLGVPTSTLRGTTGSLRIGAATARAVRDMIADGFVAWRIARRVGAAVVMANSLRAGLMGVVAERLPGCPPHVVHIHDVLPPGSVGDALNRLVHHGTSFAVANSRYAAERFAPDRSRVDLVYNPVDLQRFDAGALTRGEGRARLGFKTDDLLVGVVAQITPWKAQIDAIRAHAVIRRALPVSLLIVGSAKFVAPGTRYDNGGYLAELHAEAARLGCEDSVRFLGEREDVPELLQALDVLVMPSWEEPFGRVAVEAMAMATPVVVTDRGGPPEYVEHGVSGLLVPPHRPDRLAQETMRLLADRAFRDRIGSAGRRAVRGRFGIERYRERMLEAFDHAINASRAPGQRRHGPR